MKDLEAQRVCPAILSKAWSHMFVSRVYFLALEVVDCLACSQSESVLST